MTFFSDQIKEGDPHLIKNLLSFQKWPTIECTERVDTMYRKKTQRIIVSVVAVILIAAMVVPTVLSLFL